MNQKEITEILDKLRKEYPDAECALEHRNVYELIVSVVLSAQTTDVSVNKVTRPRSDGKGLFRYISHAWASCCREAGRCNGSHKNYRHV